MGLAPRTYQFLVGVFASLGQVLFGYDLAVISAVLGCSSYKSMFHPSHTEDGLLVSLFTAGAFFGAMFGGPLGDLYGRRWTIVTGALVFILGGSVQTAAQNLAYLWSGRALAGFAVGTLVMIIPVYQGEIAHPSIRGRITALHQLALGIGSTVARWISWATFVGLSTSAQWRIPLGIQVLPALALALLMLLFPESPRWLMHGDRREDGLRTLARLHARGDVHDPLVRAEFSQIDDEVRQHRRQDATTYLDLFRNRSTFRRLCLAVALHVSTQMTGVSAIGYFTIDFFKQIGIADRDALKYQAISNILNLFAQVACILFVDRLGRRWPLICGNLFQCVMFVIVTVLIATFPPETNPSTSASWAFIAAIWLFEISFAATCGPLSWVIPAEIFDTHTRSKAVSIASMTSFAFNTLIGQVTGVAINSVRWRFYLLFIIGNFTNAVFIYLFLPETKRVPLEEMNALFANAPLIICRFKPESYVPHDLERRAAELAAEKDEDPKPKTNSAS